jgi:membrane protease YdiL (CAAX protease family)
MPILTVISYFVALKLANQRFTLEYGLEMLSQLPLLAQFLLVEFFLGAVSEELGWRGYAIDEIQKSSTALKSALIIGVIWAFWHTPSFLIPGLSQYENGGLMSWNYIGMMVGVTAGSVLHSWAYNNTGRSIAVAGVLMHFTQNATLIFLGGIFDYHTTPTLFWPVLAVLTIITACIIVGLFGGETLAEPKRLFYRKSKVIDQQFEVS